MYADGLSVINNYNMFTNRECEFFPCHEGIEKEEFNCLFCYCPLYHSKDCGGNFVLLANGVKDCSYCTIPHEKGNYDYIVNKIKELPR